MIDLIVFLLEFLAALILVCLIIVVAVSTYNTLTKKRNTK